MRKRNTIPLTIAGTLSGAAAVVLLLLLNPYPKERPLTEHEIQQAKLDTLYNILVGPDSTSILNTMTRVRMKIDSICKYHYQGRC